MLRNNFYSLDEFFRKEIPDKSTLRIFDDTNEEPVLNIRFMNSKAVYVTGRFSVDGDTLVITKDSITSGSTKISDDCSMSEIGGYIVQ